MIEGRRPALRRKDAPEDRRITQLGATGGRCRREAIVEFSMLAYEYTTRFHHRWSGPGKPDLTDLLGSGDIQSLADLANSYENVRISRILPTNVTTLVIVAVCAAVPHLPLLLLKRPLTDLITDMVQTLIGIEAR